MPGVCFHLEPNSVDVFSGRDQDMDAWRYAMKIPGDITEVVVVNTSGLPLAGLDQYFLWSVVDEMPALSGTVTYMLAAGERLDSTSLWDFDHQTDWYVFGPAAGWAGAHQGVAIPQFNPLVSLHALHVCPAVMFHRYQIIGGPV